jgi:hypothetical protein
LGDNARRAVRNFRPGAAEVTRVDEGLEFDGASGRI